jgi:hypothetical protein
MMAQSARDFVFWAAMTVAGQDSAWALGGSPNAVDICERCHFPEGWLGGRSDPPNASLMAGTDFDGVHCDFCHQAYDPFFEDTYTGVREGSDSTYWDETNLSDTPSNTAALATYNEDVDLALSISLFNGSPFFVNNQPPQNYTENGGGQYFISPNGSNVKRASFADANPTHNFFYSRYHKSKYFCGICHDVSNPVLTNLGSDSNQPLPTETDSAYSYFHVERTFSEFILSDYGLQGGSQGKGPFAPGVFDTSLPDNSIAKCQDCHMRDLTGRGCDKNQAVLRPDESIEHPNSGQPVHDMTGGNIWVPTILASALVANDSPFYDSVNDSLLNQGAATLTLDLTAGEALNPDALLAGADRARQNLLDAVEITDVRYTLASGILTFRVQNNTGHKLISGFPEGRRMFLNIKVFSNETLIQEINPYDELAGSLKGLSYNYSDPDGILPVPQPLSGAELYVDELVYEMHPSSTMTGEQETFHFVLADDRYKDNRIPPKGFRIAEAVERLSAPRWHGVDAIDYFSTAEYAGGYDEVEIQVANYANRIEINLYYQTTSREYIEFLRDEINGSGNLTLAGEGAYIIQTDPFFSQLKEWGNTIWVLWTHNMNLEGAAPYLMAQINYIPPPTTTTTSTTSSTTTTTTTTTLPNQTTTTTTSTLPNQTTTTTSSTTTSTTTTSTTSSTTSTTTSTLPNPTVKKTGSIVSAILLLME